MDDLGQTSVKITEEYDNFHSRKYIQQVRPRSGDYFVQADHFTFFASNHWTLYWGKVNTASVWINQLDGWLFIDRWSHGVHISACTVQLQVSGYWFSLSYCSYLVLYGIISFTASGDPGCHAYSLVRLYLRTPLINSYRPLRHTEQLSTQNDMRATLTWTSTKEVAKGPVSISDKTSYRKISRILESLRLVV